jgi:hypothetical protein
MGEVCQFTPIRCCIDGQQRGNVNAIRVDGGGQLQWSMVAIAQWMAGWQRNHDEQWWRRWAMPGVTMGDGNCGGMIAKGNNGGSAMDDGMAV